MSEVIKTFTDLVKERADIRVIIGILFVVLLFKIREIYDFWDYLFRRKLTVLKDLIGEQGVTGKTREVLQEKINAESFRRATGIKAGKHLREKIISLHEQSDGRLTYLDFRRARPFLRIRRDGTLKVRKFTWLDLAQHYFYSFVFWLSFVAGGFLLVLLLFVPNIEPEPRLELAMLLYVLFFLTAAFYINSWTLLLPTARKIKAEICNRYLSEAEKEEAGRRFESHFGEIDLGHPAGAGNESVDVEYRSDTYWVKGTRISLDSIVYAFQRGLSPESIVQSFPLLSLEQVYRAITFYLANRADIDAYLAAEEEAFAAMPQPLQTDDPALYNKLIAAKAARQQEEP